MECYHSFLKRLDQLGEDMLPEDTRKDYHATLDSEDANKFARPRYGDSNVKKSQLERRSRLGLPDEESMEGHDAESLCRTLSIETLRMHAEEALEEMQSSKGELEMLEMAVRMEGARTVVGADPRMNRNGGRGVPQAGMRSTDGRGSRPLQMTQITQDPTTGELVYTKQRVSNGTLHPVTQIQRQEIAGTIFRP